MISDSLMVSGAFEAVGEPVGTKLLADDGRAVVIDGVPEMAVVVSSRATTYGIVNASCLEEREAACPASDKSVKMSGSIEMTREVFMLIFQYLKKNMRMLIHSRRDERARSIYYCQHEIIAPRSILLIDSFLECGVAQLSTDACSLSLAIVVQLPLRTPQFHLVQNFLGAASRNWSPDFLGGCLHAYCLVITFQRPKDFTKHCRERAEAETGQHGWGERFRASLLCRPTSLSATPATHNRVVGEM